MNHTLKITKIHTADFEASSGYIMKVEWQMTITDDTGNTYVAEGGNNFNPPKDGETITPLSELTEADVLFWCGNKLQRDGMINYLYAEAQKEFDKQEEDTLTESALPWG